jgi:hypothetical protein
LAIKILPWALLAEPIIHRFPSKNDRSLIDLAKMPLLLWMLVAKPAMV